MTWSLVLLLGAIYELSVWYFTSLKLWSVVFNITITFEVICIINNCFILVLFCITARRMHVSKAVPSHPGHLNSIYLQINMVIYVVLLVIMVLCLFKAGTYGTYTKVT